MKILCSFCHEEKKQILNLRSWWEFFLPLAVYMPQFHFFFSFATRDFLLHNSALMMKRDETRWGVWRESEFRGVGGGRA